MLLLQPLSLCDQCHYFWYLISVIRLLLRPYFKLYLQANLKSMASADGAEGICSDARLSQEREAETIGTGFSFSSFSSFSSSSSSSSTPYIHTHWHTDTLTHPDTHRRPIHSRFDSPFEQITRPLSVHTRKSTFISNFFNGCFMVKYLGCAPSEAMGLISTVFPTKFMFNIFRKILVLSWIWIEFDDGAEAGVDGRCHVERPTSPMRNVTLFSI